jgi:hypothetical protein
MLLWLLWVACAKHAANKPPLEVMDIDGDGVAVDRCETEPETMNGWNDDDGCPDELARLLVRVHDATGAPVAGASVLMPGSEDPVLTGEDGRTAFFELVPARGLSLDVSGGGLSVSMPLDLHEGAQEILVVLAPPAPPTAP